MTHAAEGGKALLVADLLSLVLFGAAFLVFAVPYVGGLRRARRAGDAWAAFEQRDDGRWTAMTRARGLAPFRAPAPERRTSAGLAVRRGAWTVVVLGLLVYPVVVVEIAGLV
ncbi:hypothetical protein KC207_14795 [Phycicoccus sp. BSK3Z-2]|uniref:Uncharacterized protein n=1 Tax=Phycicoccus avicenniae TaxID=2828860 RepID=A0A941I1Q9_9MICO|nr:hypothetical protein [Phycicoccus avicenniae]MBR7744561.1 hypothetical protein [Phycicoccus avicenniae]